MFPTAPSRNMTLEPRCEVSAIAADGIQGIALDLPDQHTECAQRRNENRRRKRIGGKVGDFSNGHCCRTLALWSRNFQFRAGFIHVTTPPHQIGLFKYENPSPSKPCCLLACCKPYHPRQRPGPGLWNFRQVKYDRVHPTGYLPSAKFDRYSGSDEPFS